MSSTACGRWAGTAARTGSRRRWTASTGTARGIPRRINRLCSRVLLAGALEETCDLHERPRANRRRRSSRTTSAPAPRGAMVGQNFGDGDPAELARRLGSVEGMIARHDRVLGRLADLFNMQRSKA